MSVLLSEDKGCGVLTKMIYSVRKLVIGPAVSAISKYKELVTSAGAGIGKSVGMVSEVGDQDVQALGIVDRLDKIEDWLKALAFLLQLVAKLSAIFHCWDRLCRTPMRHRSSWR